MHLLQSPHKNIVAKLLIISWGCEKIKSPCVPPFSKGETDPTRKVQFFSEYVSSDSEFPSWEKRGQGRFSFSEFALRLIMFSQLLFFKGRINHNYLGINLIAFWVVLASGVGAWGQTQKVKIAVSSRGIAFIDLYIAEDRGFFREEGLEPELIQVSANVATAALAAGEVDALGAVGLAARASQTGLPIKVLAVTGHRALFWLVSKPEFKSVTELKGTTLGITSRNGSQHLVASRLLASGGLDPNKDISTVVIGGAPALLQALLAGSIQTTALSPPTIIVARDKFKVNILAEPPKDFLSTQGGFAVTERALVEKRDLLRRMLRARTKAYRYFHENERGTAETLAKYTRLDLATTTETYRMSKFGFTANSVLTDKEMEILLRDDAKTLGLAQPVAPAKVFDFGPQREINRELGIK
jgi:ABC-type nitrate/sulfonate/bicarbonate transport system substrate-binding protein